MSVLKTIRDDFQTKQPASEKKATPLKSAAEVASSESSEARHLRREKIREKLAAEEVANFRYQQALDDVACFEAKSDGYKAIWHERRAPLEAELAEIEAKQTRNIAERKPADESLAARRSEVLNQLQDLKAARDRQSASFSLEQRRLDDVRIAAAKKVPTGKRVSEQDLFDDGDKRLLAIHALLKHDADAAIGRLDLMRSAHLSAPRQALDAQLELIEELTQARREAYQAVIDE